MRFATETCTSVLREYQSAVETITGLKSKGLKPMNLSQMASIITISKTISTFVSPQDRSFKGKV